MNTLLKTSVTALGLIIAAGLTACERENRLVPMDAQLKMPNPDYPQTTPRLPNSGAASKLVTCGGKQLSYDEEGDLAKVQYIYEPNLRREYAVGAGSGKGIIISDYEGNLLNRKVIILYDEKGRCGESFNTNFYVQDKKPYSVSTHYKYTYTASGRLGQITNVDDPSQYDLFTSDPHGMISIAHYEGGIKTSLIIYSYSANGTKLVDQNRLNLMARNLSDQLDEFLPIYGKPNDYLPTEYKYYDTASKVVTDRIEYKFNVDYKGRILKRDETRYWGHLIMNDTFDYTYK